MAATAATGSPDCAPRHGATGQDCLQDLQSGQVAHFFLHACKMTAGDMAAFMGHDTDQLVRPLRAHDQASVDEDALATRHEGVERAILDEHDLDTVGVETCCLPDRDREGADRALDLGVANEIEALTLLRRRGTKRCQREERQT